MHAPALHRGRFMQCNVLFLSQRRKEGAPGSAQWGAATTGPPLLCSRCATSRTGRLHSHRPLDSASVFGHVCSCLGASRNPKASTSIGSTGNEANRKCQRCLSAARPPKALSFHSALASLATMPSRQQIPDGQRRLPCREAWFQSDRCCPLNGSCSHLRFLLPTRYVEAGDLSVEVNVRLSCEETFARAPLKSNRRFVLPQPCCIAHS